MVGTVGRFMRTHRPLPVWVSPQPLQAPSVGKSQPSRSWASSGAAGGEAYGEIPAAWTRPSQAYRYMSSLVRGGEERPATATAAAPIRTRTVAARAGTLRTVHTASSE